jgi:hypothetical protein
MNPPTEISHSTQLLLDEIRKLFDNFNRKLDESEARWERCDSESQAARAQGVTAVEPHIDIPEQIPARQFDAVVVATTGVGYSSSSPTSQRCSTYQNGSRQRGSMPWWYQTTGVGFSSSLPMT